MAEFEREKTIEELKRYLNYPKPLCDVAQQAITLLKEQEAKNVIAEKHKILLDDSYDEAQFGEDTFYHCPSCNRNLSRTHMNKDIHFCSSCGQAVKWE